jgi:hypothetical protein
MATWEVQLLLVPTEAGDRQWSAVQAERQREGPDRAMFWPDSSDSWKKRKLDAVSLRGSVTRALSQKELSESSCEFVDKEGVRLLAHFSGSLLAELILRIPLLRQFPLIRPNSLSSMEQAAEHGFERGAYLRGALDVIGIWSSGSGICTFSDWVAFKDAIRDSQAWRFSEQWILSQS